MALITIHQQFVIARVYWLLFTVLISGVETYFEAAFAGPLQSIQNFVCAFCGVQIIDALQPGNCKHMHGVNFCLEHLENFYVGVRKLVKWLPLIITELPVQ